MQLSFLDLLRSRSRRAATLAVGGSEAPPGRRRARAATAPLRKCR